MTTDHNVPPPAGAPRPGPDHGATPAPKKSWFARHKILTGILGLIVVFMLIGVFGSDDDPEAAPSPTSPSETAGAADAEGTDSSAGSPGSTADESAAEESDADGTEPADSETEAVEAEPAAGSGAANIGEAVTTGSFEVTVTGVEDGVTFVGPEGFGEEPQGQYVIVSITVSNTGDSAETFWDSEQKLVDDQGREHSSSSDSYLLDEGTTWLEEINPGNTFQGALLFDIPADAVPTTLKVRGGFFGGATEVSLAG